MLGRRREEKIQGVGGSEEEMKQEEDAEERRTVGEAREEKRCKGA